MTRKPDVGRRRPPGRDEATRPSPAVGRRRRTTTDQQFEPEAPEMVFDIEFLDGPTCVTAVGPLSGSSSRAAFRIASRLRMDRGSVSLVTNQSYESI
jgi:hypothetical protein